MQRACFVDFVNFYCHHISYFELGLFFSLAFSLFGSPWLRCVLFGFLLFFVVFLVGLHHVVVVNFFHCFLPNCFLLVQIGFICSVDLAFPCEVLFRRQLRKGRL